MLADSTAQRRFCIADGVLCSLTSSNLERADHPSILDQRVDRISAFSICGCRALVKRGVIYLFEISLDHSKWMS